MGWRGHAAEVYGHWSNFKGTTNWNVCPSRTWKKQRVRSSRKLSLSSTLVAHHICVGASHSEDLSRDSFIDIEIIVSSWSITYVSMVENTHEVLTPNHFLLGQSSGVIPFSIFCDDPELLKKEWKWQQVITQKVLTTLDPWISTKDRQTYEVVLFSGAAVLRLCGCYSQLFNLEFLTAEVDRRYS